MIVSAISLARSQYFVTNTSKSTDKRIVTLVKRDPFRTSEVIANENLVCLFTVYGTLTLN